MEKPHYPLMTETDERFTALQPSVHQAALIFEIQVRKLFRGLAEKHPLIAAEMGDEELFAKHPAAIVEAMIPVFMVINQATVEAEALVAQFRGRN